METAWILGSYLGLSVTVDHRLDEMGLCSWEGLAGKEVASTFPDAYAMWLSEPDRLHLDGREALADVASRTMAAVREAARFGKALLVTHVAPIRVAVLSTLDRPLRLYKRVNVPNASCFRLDLIAGEVTRYPDGRSLSIELGHADLDTTLDYETVSPPGQAN